MAGELLEPLISELENVWKETHELKTQLNTICETSWSILKPPGRNSYGAFKIEEKTTTDTKNEVSPPLEPVSQDLLNDVNELISYGKQVLSLSQATSKPKTSKKNQHLSLTDTQPIVKSKFTSKKIFGNKKEEKKEGISKHSTGKSTNSQNQSNISKTKSYSGCHQSNEIKSSNVVLPSAKSKEELKEVKSLPKDEDSHYAHKCSLTLSETLRTLKMPKDLRHLLKQYYCYQEKKSKTASLEHLKITYNYEDRVCKLARTRLEYCMSVNTKLPDRYNRYVEITDREMKRNKTALSGEATAESKPWNEKSVNALILQEEKYQQLMELQLQQRLLNVLLASLD